MDDAQALTLTRRIILGLFLGGLLLLSFQVIEFFIVPVAWAAILAYVTWPLHARLRRWLRGHGTVSAVLMSLLLTAGFVLPTLLLVALLRGELTSAYEAVVAYMARGPLELPDVIRRIPWVGEQLEDFLAHLKSNREALRMQLTGWIEPMLGQAGQIVGGVGRNTAKLGIALLTAFFFYRDGERLVSQMRRVLQRFLGDRVNRYIDAVGATTKAVVYGIVLTALAQGALAGIGYWAAGVDSPVFLGALTAMVALLPFGTPFVWGSIGVWLLLTGHTLAGIGLLLWGTLVVSWVDNLVRPMVISSASKIPFLLVFFGVLGGLAAFGFVGLFLGPVILAVFIAVWHEWLEEQAPAADASVSGQRTE